MRRFYFFAIFLAFFLAACGGGSSGGSSGPTPTPTPTPPPTPTPTPTPTPDPSTLVTISGAVTYDFVPHDSGGGLNYDNISAQPVRGATVRAVNAVGALLAQDTTDASGNYAVTVAQNIDVRMRVIAELVESGSPSWDFSVTDNTSGNAVYSMEGSLVSSGSSNSTRNLHASSGWNGVQYSSERVAAPFAILDAVYEALQHILAADPDVNLSTAELRWSTNNRAVSGQRTDGAIGTSFYDPSENNMYILGDANNDTDEYDKSVIQHELAHYIEDTLSRSDSIGGPHTLSSALDMRVAFGEGFANAFSGIASGQEFYSDSSGTAQSRGFRYSLEANTISGAGWYNENSVGQIIYDIADADDDGFDVISQGFTPIYEAMTSTAYVSASPLTSIFLFADRFKDMSDAATDSVVDNLMASENINGTDEYGTGETNNNGDSIVLPVYATLSPGNTLDDVCGNNSDGEYNGLDVRRFIRVTIATTGTYQIRAVTSLGTGVKDPDVVVWSQGNRISILESGVADSETGNVALNAGEYIFEVYDYNNVDQSDSSGGNVCFDVTLTAQ